MLTLVPKNILIKINKLRKSCLSLSSKVSRLIDMVCQLTRPVTANYGMFISLSRLHKEATLLYRNSGSLHLISTDRWIKKNKINQIFPFLTKYVVALTCSCRGSMQNQIWNLTLYLIQSLKYYSGIWDKCSDNSELDVTFLKSPLHQPFLVMLSNSKLICQMICNGSFLIFSIEAK